MIFIFSYDILYFINMMFSVVALLLVSIQLALYVDQAEGMGICFGGGYPACCQVHNIWIIYDTTKWQNAKHTIWDDKTRSDKILQHLKSNFSHWSSVGTDVGSPFDQNLCTVKNTTDNSDDHKYLTITKIWQLRKSDNHKFLKKIWQL